MHITAQGRIIGSFIPLAACIVPLGTLKASPQGRGIEVLNSKGMQLSLLIKEAAEVDHCRKLQLIKTQTMVNSWFSDPMETSTDILTGKSERLLKPQD